ncbi:hypothetical protein AB0M54_24875 [Actinoplanes sp. NPDC051470]|uniref:hypothetical protein n=1 Tax=unclassified Actinoplanes TaxID=2626549 RepID=UPI00342439B3
MRVTRRVMVVLVAGVLGWGGASGFAVAAVAGVGPQGAVGATGAAGAAGPNGRDGADGKDNTTAGPRGPLGAKGPTGNQGAKGPKYQPTTHTVVSRSGTGPYTSGTVAAESGVPMTVKYTADCDSYFPFLGLSWQGDPGDYDYVWEDDGNYMSGTDYLNAPSSDSGYFTLRTQTDCHWTIRVTQKY